MFTKPLDETTLESVIKKKLLELKEINVETKDFADATDQVVKLHKMKEAEKPASASPDTLISAAASIASIIMILRHEQFNNITTKALAFVPKLR